jgi:hypothetical protein
VVDITHTGEDSLMADRTPPVLDLLEEGFPVSSIQPHWYIDPFEIDSALLYNIICNTRLYKIPNFGEQVPRMAAEVSGPILFYSTAVGWTTASLSESEVETAHWVSLY